MGLFKKKSHLSLPLVDHQKISTSDKLNQTSAQPTEKDVRNQKSTEMIDISRPKGDFNYGKKRKSCELKCNPFGIVEENL